MKQYLITLFLACFLTIDAQKITHINYSGIITLSDGRLLAFEMDLTEKEGIVNGFSITGSGTADETKSDISGTYDKKKKIYILKETQVLETNSEAELRSFCYINMEIKEVGKLSAKRTEGEFIGYFDDGKQCSSGRIILIEKDRLEKKIKKIKKKIDKKEEKEEKEESTVLITKVLKDGDDMTIQWDSKKLTIFIWDASMEDGDQIDLIINGEKILTNFKTERKRKKIRYKLNPGINILEIKAVNLGSNPPNTSRIELIDSKTKYPIITQLELNKSATIEIIK